MTADTRKTLRYSAAAFAIVSARVFVELTNGPSIRLAILGIHIQS